MSTAKTKKCSIIDGSNKIDPESIVKFREMPLEVAIRILRDMEMNVSVEEATEILALLNMFAKITIKDFVLKDTNP